MRLSTAAPALPSASHRMKHCLHRSARCTGQNLYADSALATYGTDCSRPSPSLWHHLLHRTTVEAKPGDGAPKLFGVYKLGRAEARLATGQGLTSDIKESLDPVFTQILGVTSNADEPTRTQDAQTTDAANIRPIRLGAYHRETTWCCKKHSRA
eukprot:3932729-Pleurochrysis_carterae.AAC.1